MIDLRKKYEAEIAAERREINWDIIDMMPNGDDTIRQLLDRSRVRIIDLVGLMEDTEDPVERMIHERDLIYHLAMDDVGERYEAITQLLEEV